MMTITVTQSDGSTVKSRRLCTSPLHFRNILSDELMRFAAGSSARFIYENVPIQKVAERLPHFTTL